MELNKSSSLQPARVTRRQRQILENTFWYILLCLLAVLTVFPFVWPAPRRPRPLPRFEATASDSC